MKGTYNYRNCQSLFGYAFDVHVRSGGACQLCGAGRDGMSFDLWRQMTVEHLIGQQHGARKKDILAALQVRFPAESAARVEAAVKAIDAANTVTACSFCNSMTSQHRCAETMAAIISRAGSLDEAISLASVAAGQELEAKRRMVEWKLTAVRAAYEQRFVGTPGPAAVADSN